MLAYLSASCTLGLVLVWIAADLLASDLLRAELEQLEANRLLSFDEAGLELPDLARVTGITLRHPETREPVAYVEELDVEFGLAQDGAGWQLVPRSVRGRGVRVVLSRDDGAPMSGLLRAITELVASVGGGPAGGGHRPSCEMRDVEIAIRHPGLPLQVLSDCTLWVLCPDVGPIRIELGLGSGGLAMLDLADDGGLREVTLRDLPVLPTTLAMISPALEEFGHDLGPSGMLDIDLSLEDGQLVHAMGRLEQATLRLSGTPFPLEDADVPFRYVDGRWIVEQVHVRVAGGTMTGTLEYGENGFTATGDLRDAEFRREFLDLLPEGMDVAWLEVEDGGTVDLRLAYEERPGELHPLVIGRGGLHAERMRIGEARLLVEDTVARFSIGDGVLEVEEASGRLLSGVVSLVGSFDLIDLDYDFRAACADVDLSRLDEMEGMESSARFATDIGGWLQGDLQLRGRFGDIARNEGSGQFAVRAANLWRLGLFDALAVALRPGQVQPTERQRLTCRYRVARHRMHVEMARLESSFLPLVSNKGKVSFRPDGIELDIEIVPIDVPFGPIGDLLKYIQKQLIRVQVEGPLAAPSVRVIAVKAVTKPVGNFFDWFSGLFGGGD